MSDIIQCPTCSKKYRLPATPPPTFTCKGCGTVMDLSGFGAASPPPAEAAPPPPGPGARRGRRRAGPARSGRRGRPRGAPARGRRGRHAREEEHYEEEESRPGRYRSARQGPSSAVILGSIAGVVAMGLVLVLYMNRGGDEKPPDETTTQGGPSVGNTFSPGTSPGTEPASLPPGTVPGPGLGTETPGTPAGTGPGETSEPGTPGGAPARSAESELRREIEGLEPPAGKEMYSYRRAEIRRYEWSEDVSAEERNQIEQWVETAVEVGGGDGRRAEKSLVEADLKAAGRLVSEFYRLHEEYGLEDPLGLSKMSVVDRILRRIDGIQERYYRDRDFGIRPVSRTTYVKAVIQRWNWWYDLEIYRVRTDPWDPLVDGQDEPDALEIDLPDDPSDDRPR